MVSQVKCRKIVKSCCDKNIQIKIDIKDMQGLLSYFWYSREINIEMNKKKHRYFRSFVILELNTSLSQVTCWLRIAQRMRI